MNNNPTHLRSAGIIAEYNPFHNGHIYHIRKTRELTNADCVVVVMSGNFVQRGEPAVIDKFARAYMAIHSGADLVIELPAVSATGSAQYFAKGAVAILNTLKVDTLSFGSESGNIDSLLQAAGILFDNSGTLDSLIRKYTACGLSYPAARAKAFKECFPDEDSSLFDINNSNNILGLEYLSELIRTKSQITPVTVLRESSRYNDGQLGSTLSSALAIRNVLLSGSIPDENALPAVSLSVLEKYKSENKLVSFDDFSEIIRYKLLRLKNYPENHNIADLPENLLNKLFRYIFEFKNITGLIEKVKTKELTYTRISRALCHLLLDITDETYAAFNENPCKYIRVLALNDTGAAFLAQNKKLYTRPIITKAANFKELLTDDTNASDIYNLALCSRTPGSPVKCDFTTPIIKL